MKKFYFLIFAAIVALFNFSVLADENTGVTVSVKVNNSDYVSFKPYFSPNTDNVTFEPLAFTNNELEYVFPSTATMRYFYVTPVTPAGSETIYLLSYTLYDCEDEVLVSKTPKSKTLNMVSIPATADGGRLELELGVLPPRQITVNVDGDPAKFHFYLDEDVQTIQAGTQTIEAPSSVKSIMIRPYGVSSLASVKYNNYERKLTEASSESGAVDYYYLITSPADGSTIDIKTDYAQVQYNVTIECNDPDFIKAVLVDGEPVSDWSNLQVWEGQRVAVKGQRYDYNVTASGYDDTTSTNPAYDLSKIIMADTHFWFTTTKIERSGKYVVYADDYVWTIVNGTSARNQDDNITAGYHQYGVEPDYDGDFTFFLSETPAEASDSWSSFVYVNDMPQTESASAYTLGLMDGDVLKAYFGQTPPSFYNVTYSMNGSDLLPVIVKDLITPVTNLDGHTALPGTLVSITPAEGQTLNSVTVNGTAVAPVDGVYTFTVNSATSVAIEAAAAVEPFNVTLKANVISGVVFRYAGDYDLTGSPEGTVYDLDEYDSDFGQFFQIFPNSGYYITGIEYNGVDISGDENYCYGGMYYLPTVNRNDVISVTVAMLVRDQQLTVYSSGLMNAECFLATGETPLLTDKTDGYHTVNFATADVPLSFQVLRKENPEDNVYVYLNDAPVSYYYGYDIYCQDGDVLKLYVTPTEPQLLSVNYTVSDLDVAPTVKHDLVNVVENPSTHNVLPGTRVTISSNEGGEVKSVKVNDEFLSPTDGVYSFDVNSNSNVTISGKDIISGIEGIEATGAAEGIYNLQGIRMNKDLKNLPAGIYIINGKKVNVK